jgi:hypothetical protein
MIVVRNCSKEIIHSLFLILHAALGKKFLTIKTNEFEGINFLRHCRHIVPLQHEKTVVKSERRDLFTNSLFASFIATLP